MSQTTITIPPLDPSRSVEPSSNLLRLTGGELAFIEIQGSITRLDEADPHFGRLEQDIDGRVFLYVGYQKLEGKIIDLKAPFAVLKRPRLESDYRDSLGARGLEVVDICRKKIYFNARPEPLNRCDDL